ncbi:AraC family transcriptional regulator [Salibacterium halotolerans]|uniref:AraC-type DNA-binding protein n=1 Tax=Salibacterium halotolerans TaxID=1884432 RepID=A0A1I5KW19_9BACI|nr:AraC family transcriptional regulator [Salibacterium halotolerans]SFO89187.1 AraC-type DNA-binding protein [Salibacterium halotolerans]
MRVYKNSLYYSHKSENQHPKINAYYFKEMREYDMMCHMHEEVEIMYLMEGSCLVGCNEEWIELVKGECILIDSCTPHKLEVSHRARILNLEFNFLEADAPFPSMKDLFRDNEAMKKLLESRSSYLVVKDSENILSIMKDLVFELDYQQSVDRTSLMTDLLFRQLLLKMASAAEDVFKYKNTPGHPYVRDTVRYIHEHYDQSLQIGHIAQVLKVHPTYLQRIFKQAIGTTIIEYVTSLRMNKAAILLRKTTIPIIDIASYIGISSSQYFSVLFKKYYHLSPASYRRDVYTEKLNEQTNDLH